MALIQLNNSIIYGINYGHNGHNFNVLPSIRREKLKFQNKIKNSAHETLDYFSLLRDSLFLSACKISYTLC